MKAKKKQNLKSIESKTKDLVCVVGVWHLGAVNCVGFAEKGFDVVGIEFDSKISRSLQRGKPPLYEPGLEELMKKHLASGKLRFSSQAKSVASAKYVVIAYDSPVNDRDEVDTGPVERAAEMIAPFLQPETALVITSQVPLGTSEKIENLVRHKNPKWNSGVVYTPENLRLGQAIDRFLKPDMLVLGASCKSAHQAAQKLYRSFVTKKILMDLKSAEMVKHALNAFLATSITFINEIAMLSDRLGADAVAVGQALRFDKRIGKRALMAPGLGFSGGTLARDVVQLKKFSEGLQYPAKLLKSITEVNEETFEQVIERLTSKLGSLSGKKIGVLGLTYKPGTSTLRRSPALKIIDKLNREKARCFGYDPKASPGEMKEYGSHFVWAQDIEELVEEADAIVLVTEWPQFRDLDFKAMAPFMRRAVLVDMKNYLDPRKIVDAGFDYQGFGRTLSPASLPVVGA